MTLFGWWVFILFFFVVLHPDVFLGGRLCNLDICGQYVTNIIYYMGYVTPIIARIFWSLIIQLFILSYLSHI
jgi:hypothetical protein